MNDLSTQMMDTYSEVMGVYWTVQLRAWLFLLGVGLLGLLGLFCLQALRQKLLPRLSIPVHTKRWWSNRIRQILLIYELFFWVVMASLFVVINVFWHGLIIGFLVVLTFPLLRNYITGRFLCFDQDFEVGKRIIIPPVKGVINHMNRLGIYINTNDGMQYLNYQQLQEQGYSLVTDSQMKEYCDLNITVPPAEQTHAMEHNLLYQLMGSPYLDDQYKPILISNNNNEIFRIRVLIRKGNHRKELLSLIQDWGYHCQFSH